MDGEQPPILKKFVTVNSNNRLQRTVSFDTSQKTSISSFHNNANEKENYPINTSNEYKRPRHGSMTEFYDSRKVSLSPSKESDDVVSGVRLRRKRTMSIRKPSRKRLVEKNGKRNVKSKHLPRTRYLQDIFTTIIDAKWKWLLCMFITTYLGSWLVFGIVWYIVLLVHGEKCFDNVTRFGDAFLLSLETSMTIGYGGRQITSKCKENIIIIIIQSLFSCLLEACIVGLIFTKIARPGKRQSTVVFSEKAVITKRDDKMCLMFNVGDLRKRQLVECHIRLHLFRTYRTSEGHVISNHQDQLRVGMDWYNIRDDSDRLFLLFPCTAVHVIDRKSPFYNVSKSWYENSDWELVVILEGCVEATGCSMQTRTSYLPDEVIWGADFVEVAPFSDWVEDHGILYDLSKLNDLTSASYVPTCSPREYYKSISKDPDPNDVYGEQDELWDDTNFLGPEESERVLPTHQDTDTIENNFVV